jgi:hypothetical protein
MGHHSSILAAALRNFIKEWLSAAGAGIGSIFVKARYLAFIPDCSRTFLITELGYFLGHDNPYMLTAQRVLNDLLYIQQVREVFHDMSF